MTEVIDLSKPKSNLKPFDKAGLYEKTTVFDFAAGEIVVFTPITIARVRDTERKQRFFSSIVATRSGFPSQVSFEIDADTLELAIERWLSHAERAAADFHSKAQDQEIRSRLAVPAGARMPQPS